MRTVAGNHRMISGLSRFISRCLRTRVGLTVGSRLFSAFVAATLIVGIQTTTRLEPVASAETALLASSSAPMPTWHASSSERVAFAVRSVSRLPAHVDPALPTSARNELGHRVEAHAVAMGAPEQPSASIRARGYDATAPPALS